ncbi:1047b0b3-b1b7-49da-9d07-bc0ef6658fb4 [Sclerotinia trifoliorum]|uniref:1047b0b3-b1b7-49da-9d07-bc0ef6658fb4 n=1 Tax=Sclerotinia trifoliorum TaxID=28548 RepID=A0A8H2ZQ02_9HELO|nr:1047b0b3-b1b7-49da-9d07-bc0ef6658fb4 [Sclerotinia trifoliorum]
MPALNTRIENPAPLDYSTPPFPSLYWPLHANPGIPNYLYYARDIWRFTLLWTLIVYGVTHMAVAIYATAMQLGKGKNAWQYVWVIPLIYALVAGIEALLAGSLVGLILGAIYNAGYFQMSTWIPFIWSLINVLVLILSSFSIQGGL